MRSIRSPTTTSSAPSSSMPAVTPVAVPDGVAARFHVTRAPLLPGDRARQASRIASKRPSSRSSCPPRQARQRLDEQQRAIHTTVRARIRVDVARSAKLRRIRRRTDVDAIAQHHRLVRSAGGLRENTRRAFAAATYEIVRPLQIDGKARRGLDRLRSATPAASVNSVVVRSRPPAGDCEASRRQRRTARCRAAKTIRVRGVRGPPVCASAMTIALRWRRGAPASHATSFVEPTDTEE